MTERRADDATREVSDWLKCEYMQDHVGEVMEGTIANVTGFGFFVRLKELHIDGLVHISNLDNDYYRFDMVGQRLIGESSGRVFRLGDQVTVKVLSVNLDDRQIDFELVGSNRKPRRAGKTEKDRAKKGRAESGKNAESARERTSVRQQLKQGNIPKGKGDDSAGKKGKKGKKKPAKGKKKPLTGAPQSQNPAAKKKRTGKKKK